jgi:hypothetical protein
MKIVQSLWSKPGRRKAGQRFEEVNRCSWADKKYNYFSWVLSCYQFREFYDEVELVTDAAGYDLLINRLELPYTSVKVVLDDLNDYHPELWALGKIYAYSLQDKPFIHVDGDVFIWQRFEDRLHNASLLCQSREEGVHFNRMYSQVFLPMLQHFEYYPKVMDRSISRNDGIKAVNAGILGGCNTDFFKMYAKEAFSFIDNNLQHLDKIELSLSSIIFEQFLFSALLEESNETLEYLNPNTNVLLNDFADYSGVPAKIKYIHTPGSTLKKNKHLVDALDYRLQTDHPEAYYKTMNLLRTNQI